MKYWKDDEIQKSIEMIENGYTYDEVSKVLNRSRQSVRVKLNKLGYYVRHEDSLIENTCLSCGDIYVSPKNENRKFCSQSCSATYNNKNRKRKNKDKCLQCDEELSYRQNLYCSIKCFQEHRQNKVTESIDNGNTTLDSRHYKKYLIHKHGEKCMECGWCEINPHTGNVPIELEHIDGDSSNNSLDNLKLLCPNCHSLTSTYKALNKGNGRHYRRERYKEGKSF